MNTRKAQSIGHCAGSLLPIKNKQIQKNNPHQVDDRCQAKGSKELITKQTTSSSDKHWLSEGEAAGN